MKLDAKASPKAACLAFIYPSKTSIPLNQHLIFDQPVEKIQLRSVPFFVTSEEKTVRPPSDSCSIQIKQLSGRGRTLIIPKESKIRWEQSLYFLGLSGN